jgi:hypothetical protein
MSDERVRPEVGPPEGFYNRYVWTVSGDLWDHDLDTKVGFFREEFQSVRCHRSLRHD